MHLSESVGAEEAEQEEVEEVAGGEPGGVGEIVARTASCRAGEGGGLCKARGVDHFRRRSK